MFATLIILHKRGLNSNTINLTTALWFPLHIHYPSNDTATAFNRTVFYREEVHYILIGFNWMIQLNLTKGSNKHNLTAYRVYMKSSINYVSNTLQ